MATDSLGRLQQTATAALLMARGAMPLLSAMVFIVSLGYGAGLPLIRPYLLRYLGVVPASTVAWHVGMLGGVYLFALFLFAPFWGRLSDPHTSDWWTSWLSGGRRPWTCADGSSTTSGRWMPLPARPSGPPVPRQRREWTSLSRPCSPGSKRCHDGADATCTRARPAFLAA